MSKKKIAAISASVLTVLGGIAVTSFLVSQIGNDTTPRKSEAKVPETFLKAQAKPKPEATYTDAAGFSFQYPNNVKVSDTTPTDSSYYTQVTVTKDANSIVISVRDSDKNVEYPDVIGATTLGGLAAKQYSVDGRLITSAYDSGVLYVINAPAKDIYMSQVYDLIISSFTFGSGAPSGTAADPNTSYEEEIVE